MRTFVKAALVLTAGIAFLSGAAAMADEHMRQSAQNVVFSGVLVCEIDTLSQCTGMDCTNREGAGRQLAFDFERSIACLRRPDKSCQTEYPFTIVNRADDGAVLAFPRSAMIFLLLTDGRMRGADIDPTRTHNFEGRCR